MAVPLAEVADVSVIWREVQADETARVAYLINIASAKLRSRVPFDLDARIALHATTPTAPTAVDPTIVASVVAAIVKRVLVNPDGLASTTQTVGPYSESRSFRQQALDGIGEIQVTAADIAQLLPRSTPLRARSAQLGITPSMVPPPGFRRGVAPGVYIVPEDLNTEFDEWPGWNL